jgi:ABC-type transport system involved in multi-copper enzyme maturation permease subunit
VSAVVIGETVRRRMMNLFVVAYIALLAMVGLTASRAQAPAAVWPAFVTLFAIVVSARLIGPEFSSGTLQLILVKPIGRSTYLLSRVAGVSLVVCIAIGVAAAGEMVGRAVWEGGHGVAEVGVAAIHAALRALLTASLLAFFGSVTRAYYHVAIYFSLMIGLEMTIGIMNVVRTARTGFAGWLAGVLASNLWIVRGTEWVLQNLFPEPPPRLQASWLLMVASNAAVALVLACLCFRRREVPYGAD